MKVLITGFPGTGKSTIARALKELGYHAYDLEHMEGYMHLTHRITGEPIISLPKDPPRYWFETVGRVDMDVLKVKELLDSSENVIICMLADNQQEHFNLFDKIFVLCADSHLIEHRIRARNTSDYGTHPNVLADTLELHQAFENNLIELGAIKIEVSRPLDECIADILSNINNP